MCCKPGGGRDDEGPSNISSARWGELLVQVGPNESIERGHAGLAKSPAITIGGGGNAQGAHSIDESCEETPDSYKGPQWAALILQALAAVN